MTFAEKLKSMRKQSGMSQEKLAEKIGVSRQAITKWESNTGIPDIENIKIETQRLTITEFTMDMAEAVHNMSLDEDNRRFVPDEVFETVEDAKDTVEFPMGVYENGNGPFSFEYCRINYLLKLLTNS